MGAEAGPREEGAEGWPVLEFKAGSRGCSLGCILCVSLNGEMSGSRGDRAQKDVSSLSGKGDGFALGSHSRSPRHLLHGQSTE